jgi:hypothetical protein
MSSTTRTTRKLKAGRFAALAGDFWRNPKRHLLSHSAQMLYCAALSYAADQTTDGHVPDFLLPALAGSNAAGIAVGIAAELVDREWWGQSANGYEILGYSDYNPTRAEIEDGSRRQADKAKRRWDAAGNAAGNAAGTTNGNAAGNAPPDPRPQTPDDLDPGAKAPSSESAHPASDKGCKSDLAKAVFEAWLDEHIDPAQRAKCKFNGKRRRAVEARLREGYEPERLIAAIRGVKLSRWHMGENADGRRYTGIETILRDGAQVEKFEALLTDPPQPRAVHGRGPAPPMSHDLFAQKYDPERDDPDLAWKEPAHA